MLISCEDKQELIIRLDNIRTLKILQQHGYGLLEHDWTPDYPPCTQCPESNIFMKALRKVFGESNVKYFFIETNYPAERRKIKAEICDFLGCNFRLRAVNLTYSYTIIAVKSKLINSQTRRRWIKVTEGMTFSDFDEFNEYAIFPVKTGFLIMLHDILTYSTIIQELLNVLKKMKAAEEITLEKEPLPISSEIKINIKPDIANIEVTTEDGLSFSRQIHPVDLVQAISQHDVIPEELKKPEPTEVSSSVGILPHDHNSISTIFTKTSIRIEYEPTCEGSSFFYNTKAEKTGASIGILVPAGKYLYNYFKEIYEVAFPQMLFVYQIIEDGEHKLINGCKIFALKKGPVNLESKIYRFPFANVGHDGSLCFGQNKLPIIKDLSELQTFFGFILGMESNNDLYHGKLSQRELVEMFAESDEFDESLLKEYGIIRQLL